MISLKVLGFGEVLWDKFDNDLRIGGTIFNQTAHCRRLGAKSYFVSSIGNDNLGKKIFDRIELEGINNKFI